MSVDEECACLGYRGDRQAVSSVGTGCGPSGSAARTPARPHLPTEVLYVGRSTFIDLLFPILGPACPWAHAVPRPPVKQASSPTAQAL
jgi:hypothetical protein